MRIISIKRMREFWEKHRDAEQPIKAWYEEAKKASWKTPAEIKLQYRSASFLANNRVVFNIRGNKYRLVIALKYDFQICYIRFMGTHSEYDKIDAAEI